jgi:hypothetical protein
MPLAIPEKMQAARQFPPMKTIRLKKSILLPRYTPFKTPFSDEQLVLLNRRNPVHAMIKEKFEQVPTDILRWRVTARASASQVGKAVLREHLSRRWKNAFIVALRKRGYTMDGKKFVEGKKVPGLQGTLEIPIYEGKGMNSPYEELLQAADVAVDALEGLQVQPAGKDISKQRTMMEPMRPQQGKRRAERADQSRPFVDQGKIEPEETMLGR